MNRDKIDAILTQTDLLLLVEKAGGAMTPRGDGYHGACPLHAGKNKNAFSIFRGDDGLMRWHCFADCNHGGDAIEFVKTWLGLDFNKSLEYLGGDTISYDPTTVAIIAQERARRAAEKLEQEIKNAQRALEDLRKAERHVYYHEHAPAWTCDEWRKRGLDKSWQGFYSLGGCEDFVINSNYHSPTLTIPIFDPKRNLLNIKHRLLKPQKETDKYRPEKSGLGKFPVFLGLPELGYDGDTILVVEGEIKAAVTYATIGGMETQVIGVPGQGMYKELITKLQGKHVVVCPDPGAEKAGYEFAKSVDGYYFELPAKIDDWILETGAKKDDIHVLIKQARKV